MEKQNIYQDISARTGGDIYLGVVGPVRSGKSTFIKRFMELLVLPEIKDENERKRTMDELPQSGTGGDDHEIRQTWQDRANRFKTRHGLPARTALRRGRRREAAARGV